MTCVREGKNDCCHGLSHVPVMTLNIYTCYLQFIALNVSYFPHLCHLRVPHVTSPLIVVVDAELGEELSAQTIFS